MSVVRKTSSVARAPSDSPLEFIFSDGSVDAYGDVIDPAGWDLSDFVRNPICLLGHDPNFPVGKWSRVRVEGKALRGHLTMAPAGTSARIDEVRKLIDADILKSCSVGFVPLQAEPLPGSKKGGVRYIRQLLREVSLVSLPANANALAVQAKALGVSSTTIKSAFGQTKDASLAERQERARAMVAKARAEYRARVRAPDTDADDYLSLSGLSASEQAALLGAKAEMPYAVPERRTIWDPEPLLTFCGQPVYRRKGPCGW